MTTALDFMLLLLLVSMVGFGIAIAVLEILDPSEEDGDEWNF